jgi:hypothetical protein
MGEHHRSFNDLSAPINLLGLDVNFGGDLLGALVGKDLLPAVRGVAHSLQKFESGGFDVPHFKQRNSRGPAH